MQYSGGDACQHMMRPLGPTLRRSVAEAAEGRARPTQQLPSMRDCISTHHPATPSALEMDRDTQMVLQTSSRSITQQ